MKALSIRQPWAQLICAGFPLTETVDNGDGTKSARFSGKVVIKDIENRTWATKHRGRIQVHAGKRWADEALEWLIHKGFSIHTILLFHSKQIPRGAIIGEVDIVDCVTEHESPWFTGPFGWVLTNPVLYDEPIPYKGRRGLFKVEVD